jgi:hypothetical protein
MTAAEAVVRFDRHDARIAAAGLAGRSGQNLALL